MSACRRWNLEVLGLGATALALAAALGGAAVLQAQVVVPNALTSVPGNFDNRIPFGDLAPARYQQVYLGSEVGTREIIQLRFRQDEVGGTAFGGTLPGVIVMLSSTAAVPDALGMNFSDNLGADAVTIYFGDLPLGSAASSDVPRPFDIHITGATPFFFDSSTGNNLLLDVTVAGPVALSTFDAEVTTGDSVSRVFCWFDDVCLSTDQAMLADTVGLVTQFFPRAIFSDGFESGDTSAWSGVAP